MNTEIRKYPLPEPGNTVVLPMPIGATIMCVHAEWNTPCLFAMVDPETETEKRVFVAYSNFGNNADGKGTDFSKTTYIGTCYIYETRYAVHIFETVLN
jgi:hypothetical protein